MRVGSMRKYSDFSLNQQKVLQELTKLNDQLTSGKKIKYGYQDTNAYVDTLRLTHEKKAMEQVSDNTQKARSFSDNTDIALNQVRQTLETFKVKLLNAANGSHSSTSLQAIANDLEALRSHVIDITNTSVGGNYLFSGNNFKQKPFDEFGVYSGNEQHIYAQAGNGVEVKYNIDGDTLAHGFNLDYSKKTTTNVKKWNMTTLHNKVLNKEDPEGIDREIPINKENSIKDYIGQPDDSIPTYFYMRGRKPDGDSFKDKFSMTNDATIDDLLDKIGREFGNTEIYKAVNVDMSYHGQIEVTDVKSGRLLSDFHIVGSNIDTNNIDEITSTNNAHIFDFLKSGFSYSRDNSTVSVSNDYYDHRLFTLNTTNRRLDSEELATKFDSVVSIVGEDVDTINFSINGNNFSHTIDVTKTMESLLSDIKTDVESVIGGEVDVAIQSGVISILDRNASMPGKEPVVTSQLESFSMSSYNSAKQENINSFAQHEAMSFDKARFKKDGAFLTSNVPQVIRSTNEYAKKDTSLIDVAGVSSLDEKTLTLDLIDIKGVKKVVELTLRDQPNNNGQLSTFKIIEPELSQEFDIFDEFGNKTSASDYKYTQLRAEKTDLIKFERDAQGVTYQQLMAIVSMATADNMPTENSFTSFQNSTEDAKKDVEVKLDRFGQITIRDKTTSKSKIQFSMFDKDTDRFDNYNKIETKGLKQTYEGVKSEKGWRVVDKDPAKTLDITFGFPFDGDLTLSGKDMKGNDVTTTLNSSNTLQELLDAIDNTFGDGVGIAGFVATMREDEIITRDNSENNPTLSNINFSFDQAKLDMNINKTPALTFSANNAITVDEGRVDIFNSLDEAITAVRSGSIRADSDTKDPRNIGIHNSVEVVDHLLDHINRIHTENGSIGTSLQLAYEKSELLSLNISKLNSMVLDTDYGEALVILNQKSVAYQSLLGTLSKVNQLNLINYL